MDEVARWQRKLENEFGKYGNSQRVDECNSFESGYGEHVVQNFIGHLTLLNSFLEFFADSLNLAFNISNEVLPSGKTDFPLVLIQCRSNFHEFKAAENLLLSGYPLKGYSLLRNLKDQAILNATLLGGKTTYNKLLGIENYIKNGIALTPKFLDKHYKKIKQARIKEEKNIKSLVIGKKSGLRSSVLAELGQWQELFHIEVHGSWQSTAGALVGATRDQEPLYLYPTPSTGQIAMYMNRAAEVGWMHLRTMSILQLESRKFSDDWARKWQLLDDSFQVAVESLSKECGKKIGFAFVEFLNEKLSFTPDTFYNVYVDPE